MPKNKAKANPKNSRKPKFTPIGFVSLYNASLTSGSKQVYGVLFDRKTDVALSEEIEKTYKLPEKSVRSFLVSPPLDDVARRVMPRDEDGKNLTSDSVAYGPENKSTFDRLTRMWWEGKEQFSKKLILQPSDSPGVTPPHGTPPQEITPATLRQSSPEWAGAQVNDSADNLKKSAVADNKIMLVREDGTYQEAARQLLYNPVFNRNPIVSSECDTLQDAICNDMCKFRILKKDENYATFYLSPGESGYRILNKGLDNAYATNKDFF